MNGIAVLRTHLDSGQERARGSALFGTGPNARTSGCGSEGLGFGSLGVTLTGRA
jgi:hypothetical protein